MNLENNKIVVVGGSSGMGRAIAKKSYQLGGQVTIASRSKERLRAAAKYIGEGTEIVMVDTTNEASVSQLFKQVGKINHLVISGSSVRTGTLRDMPLEDGLYTMQSKFWGPYLCAKYARIGSGGSITLFSGILSRRPGLNDAVLGPVNAAVESLGKALARDLAPVRVNTISPGMTQGTGAYSKMDEKTRQSMFDAIASRLPVGRVGVPENIADAAIMVMMNPFITGTVIDVDGGGLLV
jgi:NAD(P)-dependent dehydrogenase (short-subunit alcohol dehydrogenase family)